jgi:osmotically-inducible protein OsmY
MEVSVVLKPQSFHDRPALAEIEDPNSADLESTVADGLARDASIDASQVAVTLVDNIIVLDGRVSSQQEVDRAAEIAMSVTGVTAIRNAVRSV